MMSTSTNTVLSSEAGGRRPPARSRWSASVVLPESFPPSRPYLCPRLSLSLVLCSRTLLPYARVNLQSHSCSASSSSSSSAASAVHLAERLPHRLLLRLVHALAPERLELVHPVVVVLHLAVHEGGRRGGVTLRLGPVLDAERPVNLLAHDGAVRLVRACVLSRSSMDWSWSSALPHTVRLRVGDSSLAFSSAGTSLGRNSAASRGPPRAWTCC